VHSELKKAVAAGKTEEMYMDCVHLTTLGYHLAAEIIKNKVFETVNVKGKDVLQLVDYNSITEKQN